MKGKVGWLLGVLDRSIVHVAANRFAYGVVGVVAAATASMLIGRMVSVSPAFPIIGFTLVFIGMFALRLFPDDRNTWSVAFARHALVIAVALAIVTLIALAVVAAIVLVIHSGAALPAAGTTTPHGYTVVFQYEILLNETDPQRNQMSFGTIETAATDLKANPGSRAIYILEKTSEQRAKFPGKESGPELEAIDNRLKDIISPFLKKGISRNRIEVKYLESSLVMPRVSTVTLRIEQSL